MTVTARIRYLCLSVFIKTVVLPSDDIQIAFTASLHDIDLIIEKRTSIFTFNKNSASANGFYKFYDPSTNVYPYHWFETHLFKIMCHVKIIPSINDTIKELKPSVVNGKLLDDEEFSDFTISAESQTFEVHKSILAAASPIFMNMLTVNMKEKIESTVHIF